MLEYCLLSWDPSDCVASFWPQTYKGPPSSQHLWYPCTFGNPWDCCSLCRDISLCASLDTEPGSVGLLGTKSFCVPYSFDYRKQPSFSLHDLPWVPMESFKQLLIRKGRGWETREKQTVKGNNSAALGQSPGSPSTDTCNNIFELFCRYWNPFQVGEVNNEWWYAAHKHVDPRPVGTWRLMMLTSTYLTTSPSEECPWADHALFEPLL